LDEETQSDALNDWRERLQERLEQAPEDAKSWYLLGHAWLKLGQPNAAAQSFARTDALTVSDVSVKFYWLQARLLASNGELDRVSEGLANELLSIDPNNGPVLELLSVTMMQRGNLREAIRLMNRAITASVSIDRQIALAGAIGVLRSRMEAADPRVAVQISASTKPPDTAVVFVVARPPGGGMPYAAIRRPAAMLPFNVQLDDLVSMSEQRILSAAEQFEVLVRVSNQGIAKANPEDWVWQSEVLSQQDLQNGKVLQALLQPD
jgi:cytochrome c-type biogenesis protein CcmH